jgi:hypothetical protein
MRMKTYQINGTDVTCSHEIKTDEKTHQTAIHVTVKAGNESDAVELTHVLTIGSADDPLPVNYGDTELQIDLDVFRLKHCQLAEGKLRAKRIAKSLK